MRRSLVVTTCLLAGILARPVAAQIPEETPAAEPEEPEYLVEVIVFRYRDGAQSTDEQWSARRPQPSDYDTELLPLDEAEAAADEEEEEEEEPEPVEEELTPEEVLELPTQADLIPVSRTQFQLNDIARRLAAIVAYEPLIHVGWKQKGYPLEIAPAYELQRELGQANLSGSIIFSKGRYLRLDIDIEYRPYGGAYLPAPDPQQYDPFAYGDAATHSPVFYIAENRRGMRSNEIHFFDNPQFAVLARVTPLSPPESETEETPAEQALNN